jgi:methionine sulfoxide reductase heme-binding subunit
MRFTPWTITTIVAGILALFFLALCAWSGFSEEGVRLVVRSSARSSVLLFLLAFSASSLHGVLRTRITAWFLRNRRYLGVTFAFSHGYHLLALIALAVWFPHPFRDDLNGITLVGGGVGYGFVAAMATTSSDAAQRWLGQQRWRRLHTIGSYYLWFIFTQSYAARALQDSLSMFFSVLLVLVLFLRQARR